MKTAAAIAREIQRADICTEQNYLGEWEAVDLNTYDCDHNGNGFVCTDHVGYGRTPLDAIVDLLDKKEEG